MLGDCWRNLFVGKKTMDLGWTTFFVGKCFISGTFLLNHLINGSLLSSFHNPNTSAESAAEETKNSLYKAPIHDFLRLGLEIFCFIVSHTFIAEKSRSLFHHFIHIHPKDMDIFGQVGRCSRTKEHFPFVQGVKRGFSADRNLVGEEDLDGDLEKIGELQKWKQNGNELQYYKWNKTRTLLYYPIIIQVGFQ